MRAHPRTRAPAEAPYRAALRGLIGAALVAGLAGCTGDGSPAAPPGVADSAGADADAADAGADTAAPDSVADISDGDAPDARCPELPVQPPGIYPLASVPLPACPVDEAMAWPTAMGYRVAIPLAEGRLVALAACDGSTVWTSAPGGPDAAELLGSPLRVGKRLFVAWRPTARTAETARVSVLRSETGEPDAAFPTRMLPDSPRIHGLVFARLGAAILGSVWVASSGERGWVTELDLDAWVKSGEAYMPTPAPTAATACAGPCAAPSPVVVAPLSPGSAHVLVATGPGPLAPDTGDYGDALVRWSALPCATSDCDAVRPGVGGLAPATLTTPAKELLLAWPSTAGQLALLSVDDLRVLHDQAAVDGTPLEAPQVEAQTVVLRTQTHLQAFRVTDGLLLQSVWSIPLTEPGPVRLGATATLAEVLAWGISGGKLFGRALFDGAVRHEAPVAGTAVIPPLVSAGYALVGTCDGDQGSLLRWRIIEP